MKVDIEEIGPCRNRIRITLSGDKVSETFNRHYRDLKSTVRIKGFRPGKVPQAYLERKFGHEIAKQVKADLLGAALDQALKDNNLEPIGDPQIDLGKVLVERDRDLTFEAVVEVRPAFELGTYTGITVERPAVEVSDEEIEAEILRLRRRRASLEPIEGTGIGDEDILFGTVSLLAGDREVVKDQNVSIGPRSVEAAGLVVKDLRARALEAGVGGTISFEVTVPHYFPDAEVRGKKGTMILTIQEAKRMVLPEADDAFAESFDFDDLAELRDKIRESLLADKHAAADRAVEDRILEKIMESTPFSVPEGLLAKETERIIARARLEFEFSAKSSSEIEEALAERADQQKAEVERSLKAGFLLDAIAGKEKIFVTEEELNRHFEMLAARHGKDAEEMRRHYEERDLLSEVRYHLREAKTRAFLRERARIV